MIVNLVHCMFLCHLLIPLDLRYTTYTSGDRSLNPAPDPCEEFVSFLFFFVCSFCFFVYSNRPKT